MTRSNGLPDTRSGEPRGIRGNAPYPLGQSAHAVCSRFLHWPAEMREPSMRDLARIWSNVRKEHRRWGSGRPDQIPSRMAGWLRGASFRGPHPPHPACGASPAPGFPPLSQPTLAAPTATPGHHRPESGCRRSSTRRRLPNRSRHRSSGRAELTRQRLPRSGACPQRRAGIPRSRPARPASSRNRGRSGHQTATGSAHLDLCSRVCGQSPAGRRNARPSDSSLTDDGRGAPSPMLRPTSIPARTILTPKPVPTGGSSPARASGGNRSSPRQTDRRTLPDAR